MSQPTCKRKGFYITQSDPGCYSTIADLNRYITILENSNYYRTSSIDEASLVLVSTCVALEQTEALSFQAIETLIKSKNKDAKLIVCGCMAKTHRALIQKKYSGGVYGVFGPREEAGFIDLLELAPKDPGEPLSETKIFELNREANSRKTTIRLLRMCNAAIRKFSPGAADRIERTLNTAKIYDPESYVIRVAEGCAGACTYCIIKKARGSLVSRPLEDIRREAEQAAARGYRHLVVVGEDFSSYGIDIGQDYPALVKALLDVAPEMSLSLCHVNPARLIKKLDKFLEVIRPGRILNIEYTVQHGSNRILSLMNRNHKIEDYIDSVHALRKRDPGITIKSHLIVGFPGETAADVRDALRLVRRVRFDKLSVFMYSDREGTQAISFPDKVSYHKKFLRKTLVEAAYSARWLRHIITGSY